MSRRGFTLLETMVALVILGLVAASTLSLLGSAVRAAHTGREWSQATAHAEEGMELAKLDLAGAVARGDEQLDGGFVRRVAARSHRDGLSRVTVLVRFSDGAVFELERLFEVP